MMTREEFIKVVETLVAQYIAEGVVPQSNAQLRVNPVSKSVAIVSNDEYLSEIADNIETTEDAAAADGLASETSTDWQSSQNPDFYPILTLLHKDRQGNYTINTPAIDHLATIYHLT